MYKKFQHKPEDNVDAWLMTYADLITLLLCFFTILLSVSEPRKDRFEEMKEQIMSEFRPVQSIVPLTSPQEDVLRMIESQGLGKDVIVTRTRDGDEIELSSGAFFEPGQAMFRQEAIPMLTQVLKSLKNMDQDGAIEIEGHTDNVPISNAQFPSNWELSAGRAAAVVRFFVEHGIEPGRLKASGFADTKPKLANVNEFGQSIPANQSANRRIVIRLKHD